MSTDTPEDEPLGCGIPNFWPAFAWAGLWLLGNATYVFVYRWKILQSLGIFNSACILGIVLGFGFAFLPSSINLGNKTFTIRRLSIWFVACSATVAIPVSYFAVVLTIVGRDESNLTAGTLGDMFGAFNAFVAALALVGAGFAVWYQRKELVTSERANRVATRLSVLPMLIEQEYVEASTIHAVLFHQMLFGRPEPNPQARTENVRARLIPMSSGEVSNLLTALIQHFQNHPQQNAALLCITHLAAYKQDLNASYLALLADDADPAARMLTQSLRATLIRTNP